MCSDCASDVTIPLGDVIMPHNGSLGSMWQELLQYQMPLDEVHVETTLFYLTHLKSPVQFHKYFPS